METIVSLLIGALDGLLAFPVAFFFIEIVAALNFVSKDDFEGLSNGRPQRVAVVVPAHNEGAGLIPTIKDILPQLGDDDRLIVVADNCTDDTAAVAEGAGALVLVRNNPSEIGKGYALAFGIRHLKCDPPDFVIFIDADCRIQADMIPRMAAVTARVDRPVQATFLMKSPKNSPIDHSFAEFAWIIKNWVRPLGLRSLNYPVQLMGTGMMFPWETIRRAPLASGSIVEDLKLGLDLAAAGKAPYFYPFVVQTSDFPANDGGTRSQRLRWVQGHLETLFGLVPRLLGKSIASANFDLLALTLDLAIPPLSLLGLALVAAFGLTCVAALATVSHYLIWLSAANLTLFLVGIWFAWWRFGRDVITAGQFARVPGLALGKARFYLEMALGRKAKQWVRTDRTKKD